MRKLALGITLAMAALTAGCGGNNSSQVHDTLAKAGLLGNWADDCSNPAGPLDPHIIFSAPPTGDGRLEFNLGDESNASVYTIQSARQLDGGKVLLETTDQSDHTVDEQIMLVNGDRFQVYSNVQKDNGRVFVKNGIMVPSGGPANWATRCK